MSRHHRVSSVMPVGMMVVSLAGYISPHCGFWKSFFHTCLTLLHGPEDHDGPVTGT